MARRRLLNAGLGTRFIGPRPDPSPRQPRLVNSASRLLPVCHRPFKTGPLQFITVGIRRRFGLLKIGLGRLLAEGLERRSGAEQIAAAAWARAKYVYLTRGALV